MSSPAANSLPNPYTPLLYVPETFADELEVTRYIWVAALGAFLWDWLMSLSDEYKMVRKGERSFLTLVYFFSRVITLVYLFTSTLFQLAPISDCQSLQLAANICCFLAVPSASFLFYARVRDVFHEDKIVQIMFGVSWIGVFAGSLTMPFSGKAAHILPTQYCMSTDFKSFVSAAVIISTLNNLFLFSAISIKHVLKKRFEESAYGGNGRLFRAMFTGDQGYYLATICVNLIAMITMLTTSLSVMYRALLFVPNNALITAVACRVFREAKLEIINAENKRNSESEFMYSNFRTSRASTQYPVERESRETKESPTSLRNPPLVPRRDVLTIDVGPQDGRALGRGEA